MLLGNGPVITLREPPDGPGLIPDGGVLIRGGEIVELGETAELRAKYPEEEYRDVRGKIIMPGLINTHMHLYSTFARGIDLKTVKPPRNFREILEMLWWRLDQSLNEDDIYYSALYGLLSCLKMGVTTLFDHHASFGMVDGSLDLIARAVKEVGLRASLSFEISDRGGKERALASLRENERFLKKVLKAPDGERHYLGGMIGLHASFTLEEKSLEQAALLADRLGTPFHIHTAEGEIDLRDSRERGYQGVADRLDHFGIWRPGTLAVHGVHLEERELELIQSRQTCLIHNPQSNMGNGVGAAPVKKALEKGLMVGLGTDGYTADMFETIRTANLLQQHEARDPRGGGDDIYRLAFTNNREIAAGHFREELGVLKKGAAADLITVDYQSPTPINRENFFAHLLSGAAGGMVDTVIVGGRILLENREVKGLDEERIYQRVREQAGSFWERF